MSSRIVGFGHYVPKRRISNAEIEQELELEAGWIERRTGIQWRHHADPSEAASDMALHSARMALNQAQEEEKVTLDQIGLLLFATSTPDHLLPPSAPLLAHRLDLPRCGALDLAGACCGFLYALMLAEGFVRLHKKCVLLVASNILSRRLNVADRGTRVLFGDAAGAIVLAPSSDPQRGILGLDLTTRGEHYDLIQIPVGGSRHPYMLPHESVDLFTQIKDGSTVFTEAISLMIECSQKALAQARMAIDQIDWWIPHQANQRILDRVASKLHMAQKKIISYVASYGNSSAATIPLSLSCAYGEGKLKPGKKLLLTAAGAGLTGVAMVFRL